MKTNHRAAFTLIEIIVVVTIINLLTSIAIPHIGNAIKKAQQQSRAETNEPKTGDKPPPLGLEDLLQAPAGANASWAALKGKVVVLEFWATWCGPCVAAVPHLNELADQFQDKPVLFIAITDEEQKVVETFLKKKRIHAWIGLDTDKSMFKAYGVTGIPHTVVVDKNGKIAGITHPTALTEKHLKDLLAGKKIALASPQRGEGLRAGEFPGNTKPESAPLFQVIISPSESENNSSASGGGRLTVLGSTVMNILTLCYSINSMRIVTNSALPDSKFDFVIKTPVGQDNTAKDWLRQAVETTFGLTAQREPREMDVFVLTAGSLVAERLTPTASTEGSSSSFGPGRFKGVNQPISSLAWGLESILKKPVIDQTALTNRYDLELQWEEKDQEHPDPDTLIGAVREQLGLDLTPAKRPVEVLVVDKVK